MVQILKEKLIGDVIERITQGNNGVDVKFWTVSIEKVDRILQKPKIVQYRVNSVKIRKRKPCKW